MTVANPSIPLSPPREWFTPPVGMPKDAGCIVEPDGRIFGYLCHWGSVLMDGSKDRWSPPRSRAGYAYAHTGDTVCADGSTIKTANLGGDAGHAPAEDRGHLSSLQSFYENTQTQLARVRYGEDENGIWFAGACWPTLTDLDVAKLRASARSGHWAAVGDWKDLSSGRAGYELVGACLVNVPGLKYARADKAASGVLSLRPISMAAEANHAGAMVALYLDAGTAGKLAVDGGEPADDLHITLAYFDDEAAARTDWDAIHALVANIGAKHMPIAGKVSGHGVFRTDEGGVLWAAPDVPGLAELRTELVQALDTAGFAVRKDHGFQPHITLLYGTGSGFAEVNVPTVDLNFDRLTLAVGGDMTQLSIGSASIIEGPQHIAASGTVEFATDAPAPGVEIPVSGVLVMEDVVTEDGRLIQAGAIEWRETPLPLYAKLENTGGHDDAQLVGRIDQIWRDEATQAVIRYSGMVAPEAASEYGQRVLDAIAAKMLKGVSIDGIAGPEDVFFNENDVCVFQRMVIGGATLTPMPAMGGATVTIGEQTTAGGFSTMATAADSTTTDDGSGGSVDTQVEQTQADATQIDDKFAALMETVTSLADRVEYLIGVVESASTSAAHAAAVQRLNAL